jgi:hypothetical protein
LSLGEGGSATDQELRRVPSCAGRWPERNARRLSSDPAAAAAAAAAALHVRCSTLAASSSTLHGRLVIWRRCRCCRCCPLAGCVCCCGAAAIQLDRALQLQKTQEAGAVLFSYRRKWGGDRSGAAGHRKAGRRAGSMLQQPASRPAGRQAGGMPDSLASQPQPASHRLAPVPQQPLAAAAAAAGRPVQRAGGRQCRAELQGRKGKPGVRHQDVISAPTARHGQQAGILAAAGAAAAAAAAPAHPPCAALRRLRL